MELKYISYIILVVGVLILLIIMKPKKKTEKKIKSQNDEKKDYEEKTLVSADKLQEVKKIKEDKIGKIQGTYYKNLISNAQNKDKNYSEENYEFTDYDDEPELEKSESLQEYFENIEDKNKDAKITYTIESIEETKENISEEEKNYLEETKETENAEDFFDKELEKNIVKNNELYNNVRRTMQKIGKENRKNNNF